MSRKLRINFIVPVLDCHSFTGGIYCIMKYADGLAEKGHHVNVIPFNKSTKPEWISCRANLVLNKERKVRGGFFQKIFKKKYACPITDPKFHRHNEFVRRGITMEYMGSVIPEADVTIASSWETAEMVFRFGTGKHAYFIQHLETVFFDEKDSYEKRLCELSYQLPLNLIANSSWVQGQLEKCLARHSLQETVYKCVNAVDLDIYQKLDDVIKNTTPGVVKIISYGGNKMRWKGFEEMAQAVAAARRALPDVTLEWSVYGHSSLPPDNPIAPYTSLGFLRPTELVRAYNQADFLLSASWYESFPLFPIEAMACGLAAITTQQGTEDYAFHGETAEIVKERDVDSISQGIIKLAKDTSYRQKLAENGYQSAQRFNWKISVDQMEKVLSGICGDC